MSDDIRELLEAARVHGWAMEPVARSFLEGRGVPVAEFAWARDLDEARQALARIGPPVVIKVVSPEVVHKSDVGGVAVGVSDEPGLEAAWERMAELPGFQGVVVDEMVVGGVELIVGSKLDPQFGPVVLVGIGGTSVEIYADVAIRMAPLTAGEARAALATLKGRKLLDGHRGAEPADLDALVALIVRFSEVAHALGDRVESMDLNPVLVTGSRAVVADARIMLPK